MLKLLIPFLLLAFCSFDKINGYNGAKTTITTINITQEPEMTEEYETIEEYETTEVPVTTNSPFPSFVCPPKNLVTPCACTNNLGLLCSGGAITQYRIHRTWAAIRQANNLTLPEQWLTIPFFQLSDTEIPKLDMSPFFYTRVTMNFDISENNNLTSLYNGQINSEIRSDTAFPTSDITNDGLIDADKVSVNYNPLLSAEGMEDFFPSFTPSITQLDLDNTNVTGGSYLIGDDSGEFEWLPGFSRLVNLETLMFSEGHRTLISDAPFKRNRNLRLIRIQNSYVEFGPNAFALDPPDVDFGEEQFLKIDLTNTRLDDSSFDSIGDPVLGGMNRPTELNLKGNNFEFLSQSNFQNFLDENELNILTATYNNFFCDQRMKWLKDGRDRYEHRVLGVLCTNDPGEDVFSTSLIS